MATAKGFTLQDPLILLESELESVDYQHISLLQQVPTARGNKDKCKEEVLGVENGLNVEYLLRTVLEFCDAAITKRLRPTGPNLYSYFCQNLTSLITFVQIMQILWMDLGQPWMS